MSIFGTKVFAIRIKRTIPAQTALQNPDTKAMLRFHYWPLIEEDQQRRWMSNAIVHFLSLGCDKKVLRVLALDVYTVDSA